MVRKIDENTLRIDLGRDSYNLNFGNNLFQKAAADLKAEGRNIITIEGIQDEARKIAEFLVAEGVDQCGYCSPGLVMAIYSMGHNLTEFTFEEIKHYLAGNMCRCSGYEGQHRAIKKYLEANYDRK